MRSAARPVYTGNWNVHKLVRGTRPGREKPGERQTAMTIKRLRNTAFGSKALYTRVTGWAFYEASKGWLAFSSNRDQYGILTPYSPVGGRKALQAILDAGGFATMDGMEYVQELGA